MSDAIRRDDIETSRIVWNGIEVKVQFERSWLGRPPSASHPCHIEVQVISPAMATLPITETGYRSHFTSADAVDAAGGAVAYVTAWLEHAATAGEWQAREAAGRQLSLF